MRTMKQCRKIYQFLAKAPGRLLGVFVNKLPITTQNNTAMNMRVHVMAF